MKTIEEKKQVVQQALDLICERADGGEEVLEIMLNAFCFLTQDMGFTLHQTMSMVMDYYKRNPVSPDANH